MPDLEMLLRDVRPAPDPAWATKLDARVAARFPKPTPAWKKPLIVFREHFFAFSAVATVGCAHPRARGRRQPVLGGTDEPARDGMRRVGKAARKRRPSDSAGGGSTAQVPRRR